MATRKSKKRATTAVPKEQKATWLLRADHKLVSSLFADYDKARSPRMIELGAALTERKAELLGERA